MNTLKDKIPLFPFYIVLYIYKAVAAALLE
jgi:hypothetical protein